MRTPGLIALFVIAYLPCAPLLHQWHPVELGGFSLFISVFPRLFVALAFLLAAAMRGMRKPRTPLLFGGMGVVVVSVRLAVGVDRTSDLLVSLGNVRFLVTLPM